MTDLEMSGGGWIDASERPPTERDADEQNCVLAWHALNGAMITGWHQLGRNRYLTHWQKLPGKPEGRSAAKTERSPT